MNLSPLNNQILPLGIVEIRRGLSFPIPKFDMPLSQASYSGGVFLDYGPNGRDGTPYIIPTFTSGPDGTPNNATVFNADQQIIITDIIQDILSDMIGTISIWFQTENTDANRYLYIFANTSGSLYSLHVFSQVYYKHPMLIFNNYYGNPPGWMTYLPTGTDGFWHHICIVQNGSIQACYFDGVQGDNWSSGNSGWFADIGAFINKAVIGAHRFGPSFIGDLALMKIWDVALSQDEVNYLFENKL